jgi:hypothetical protein
VTPSDIHKAIIMPLLDEVGSLLFPGDWVIADIKTGQADR